ncbi:T9SS type A sorting domain-containing protein [candidate division KSB1 bacterium]|nr:T9SS type A sorting domain-containing protein [candidate division KSB1 bacterium]
MEVPRDIYYWYIVHPKISDEIPAFIDPEIIESNYSHSNNITSPENGYFWRDFLFNYNDPGYALLKDLLKECKIVWNQFGGSLPGADPAINVLSRWLNRSMTFTSNEERPHQPVRIYRKHIGRCGEYGDMRAAIARAALIPAANVGSYSTDHVWNEFWDQGWIHWDDAIDNPYMYLGSGWNKKFGSVFRWKSDGSFIPVTDRYTREQSTIYIYALDKNGNPIDGARIILYTPGLDGELWFATYGVTDIQGKVTFIVGTDRPYHAKMQSDYGNVPACDSSHLLRIVSNSQADREYTVSMTIDAEGYSYLGEDMAIPQFDDKRFYLNINYHVPFQIIRGTDIFDDLNQYAYQFIQQPVGRTNFVIMDEVNYDDFTAGNSFQGFHTSYQSKSDIIGFEFDGSSDWYCVFDNSNSLHTLQHLTGKIELMSVYDATIPEVALLSNYPNPVRLKDGAETTITFQLPRKTNVDLTIYNILGQEVKTLLHELRYAGEFNITWDGKDTNNRLVPTGVYLCRIATDHGDAFSKMLIIH